MFSPGAPVGQWVKLLTCPAHLAVPGLIPAYFIMLQVDAFPSNNDFSPDTFKNIFAYYLTDYKSNT